MTTFAAPSSRRWNGKIGRVKTGGDAGRKPCAIKSNPSLWRVGPNVGLVHCFCWWWRSISSSLFLGLAIKQPSISSPHVHQLYARTIFSFRSITAYRQPMSIHHLANSLFFSYLDLSFISFLFLLFFLLLLSLVPSSGSRRGGQCGRQPELVRGLASIHQHWKGRLRRRKMREASLRDSRFIGNDHEELEDGRRERSLRFDWHSSVCWLIRFGLQFIKAASPVFDTFTAGPLYIYLKRPADMNEKQEQTKCLLMNSSLSLFLFLCSGQAWNRRGIHTSFIYISVSVILSSSYSGTHKCV